MQFGEKTRKLLIIYFFSFFRFLIATFGRSMEQNLFKVVNLPRIQRKELEPD